MILTIDQFLSNISPELVMGTGALFGASLRAALSIYKKKQELGNKFEFKPEKIIDTVWQSTVAGVAFAMSLGPNHYGGIIELIVSVFAGAGIDSFMNKAQFMNLVEMAKQYLDASKTKTKKKK